MMRREGGLGGVRTRLERAIGRELFTIAEMTLVIARALAPEGRPPRDEPRLKDSFSTDASGLTAHLRVSNPHAAYVEFGTGRRGAGSPAPPKMPGAGGYDPDWAGMRAQPYLYPAAQIARGRYLEMLRVAARRVMREHGGGA